MKDIKENYEPVSENFHQKILDLIAKRKFIKVHYFNEYHEYISSTTILKEIITNARGDFALGNTGEEIRLDKIVRLEGQAAPGYSIEDFTCDC